VAQQLLHGADVVAGLEQVGGEAVPERVAAHPLAVAGSARVDLTPEIDAGLETT
jgi:hypothetical protein